MKTTNDYYLVLHYQHVSPAYYAIKLSLPISYLTQYLPEHFVLADWSNEKWNAK